MWALEPGDRHVPDSAGLFAEASRMGVLALDELERRFDDGEKGLHQSSSNLVRTMVRTTPTTTRYTPRSKS